MGAAFGKRSFKSRDRNLPATVSPPEGQRKGAACFMTL